MEKQELSQLREGIISSGKRSKRFSKFAAGKEGAKYYDPDNPDVSGAISERDCEILYDIVHKLQPKTIFEIGTWFGTSAAVMHAAAPEAKIYTCDKHDLAVVDAPEITKYLKTSSQAIKKLQKKGIKIDLVFADGRLLDGDERRLVKMGMKVFVTHDYEGREKGYRNIKKIKKFFKGKFFKTDTTIAGIYG